MKKFKKSFGLLSIVLVAIIAFILVITPVNAVNNDSSRFNGTLQFDSDGGSQLGDFHYECGKALGKLPVPTKKNMKFYRWKNAAGKTVDESTVVCECGTIKLKAEWVEECDEACKRCKDYVSNQAWNSLYDVQFWMDEDDPSYLKIWLGKNIMKRSITGTATFKISRVEYWDMNEDYNESKLRVAFNTEDSLEKNLGIKKDARLTPSNGISFKHNINKLTRVKVFLTPVNSWTDKELTDKCGDNVKLEIQVAYDKYGGASSTESQLAIQLPQPTENAGGMIDCSKTHTAGSFEEAFCNDMKAAEASSSTQKYTFDGTNDTFSKLAAAKKLNTPTFKCDPFKQLKTSEIPPTVFETKKDPTLDAKYYENKSYLLGTMTFTLNLGNYVRHYTAHVADPNKCLKYLQDNKDKMLNNDGAFEEIQSKVPECKLLYDDANNAKAFKEEATKNDEAISCDITCKEVVTVEYGHPVASRAGLCFDYKVKVTSRVNCESTEPKAPRLGVSTCLPEPGCNHGSGFVDHAAGPSEEFDSCVALCDGGKYSTKCTSQCYKKIYGKGANALTKTEHYNFEDFVGTPLSNTVPRIENSASCEGYYLRVGTLDSPRIIWKPENVFGRWYCVNSSSGKAEVGHACLKTTAEGGGIAAVCGCSAECRWNGCRKGQYINPSVSELDDLINAVEYKKALDACSHYSKCSETTATFNFKVNYMDENNKETTINFPYSSSDPNLVDSITYNRDAKTVACSQKNSALNTTILKSDGCYECAEKESKNDTHNSSSNWYMTEWSFPGTWINNKTNEISYEPKNGSSWDKLENKFCLPKNAGNVNRRWYNAYYIAKSAGSETYSYFDQNNTSDTSMCKVTKCKKYEEGNDGSFPNSAAEDINYNIKAESRSFGLFRWNIDIQCFYATNTKFPYYDGGESCEVSGDNCGGDSSRIRSVDLGNLFPAEDGSKLADSTKTGRDVVPFNWSKYASNGKTTDYTSQPSDYTAWLQSTNYKIYEGEDYLDYEFTLTKDLISKLRNAKHNYTEFGGEIVANSVYNYQSNLFRGGNALIHSSKIPSVSVLRCNNIRNYQATDCENVHGSNNDKEDGEVK